MPTITFESTVHDSVYAQSAEQHRPNAKTIAAMQEAKEIEDDF